MTPQGLIAVGISHRTAPVDVLGRCVLGADDQAAIATALAGAPGLGEFVALSTCNRKELDAVGDDPLRTRTALANALAESAASRSRSCRAPSTFRAVAATGCRERRVQAILAEQLVRREVARFAAERAPRPVGCVELRPTRPGVSAMGAPCDRSACGTPRCPALGLVLAGQSAA